MESIPEGEGGICDQEIKRARLHFFSGGPWARSPDGLEAVCDEPVGNRPALDGIRQRDDDSGTIGHSKVFHGCTYRASG